MVIKNQHLVFFTTMILSFIICLDMLVGPGEPATFDGPIHITNIAQFYTSLKSGDFPVSWANNFANLGSPIPIVAQQLPNYFGALLMLFIGSPLFSYKIMMFLGYFLASFIMYLFLKRITSHLGAFTGAAIFTFSAYRIINLYIRGAGPESLALIWLPLILIGVDAIIKKQKNGVLITLFGLTGLILTHPLIFFAFQIVLIPYILMSWIKTKDSRSLVQIGICYILSLMIGAYYLIPLIMEMKYFVISKKTTQLIPDQYLSIYNYLIEDWSYYGDRDIFVRKNVINVGVLETVLLISILPMLFLNKTKKMRSTILWIIPVVTILILLTFPLSEFIYLNVPFMDSLQFPWRMLTPLSIFPPIIAALWVDFFKQSQLRNILVVILIMLAAIMRIPQAYSKNSTTYTDSHYLSTTKNLYFDEMNTLWTGSTHEYPPRLVQAEIISGDGAITESTINNSVRTYQVDAVTPLRLVDYTFYFPGWNVYVDGVRTPIEFQDEKYRGIITYSVPEGTHSILVRFEPTKIRLAGRMISLIGLFGSVSYMCFLKRKSTVHKLAKPKHQQS